MGYSTNTQMQLATPLEQMKTVTGTWAINASSNVWTLDHTAAAETSTIHAPIRIPGNAAYNAGGTLQSIDIWWTNATANRTDITATLYNVALPAQAGSIAATAYTTTYDSAHDTAAKRYTQAQHKMTVTFGGSIQVKGDMLLELTISVQAAATSAFKLQGVRSNWTLRV